MTRDPVTVGEGAAAWRPWSNRLERRHIKRLPVLRDGKIVGIVSRANLTQALVNLARGEEASAGDDPAIHERILAAFAKQPWAPQINVVVKEAVAELWGTITDERERQACIVTAENVAGVRAVHDHLVWVEPISAMGIASPEDDANTEQAKTVQAKTVQAKTGGRLRHRTQFTKHHAIDFAFAGPLARRG